MTRSAPAPVAIPVSLFLDYTCPFSYLASEGLERLRAQFPLKIRWRFVESRPGIPVSGCQPAEQGLSPALLAQQDRQAAELATAKGIEPPRPRRLLANSRRALLLALATQTLQPARFAALHRSLFRAYLIDGRNIGDPEILLSLAREQGLEEVAESAWGGPTYYEQLLAHVTEAQRLNLSELPSLRVGPRLFGGATAIQTLEQALRQNAAYAETH